MIIIIIKFFLVPHYFIPHMTLLLLRIRCVDQFSIWDSPDKNILYVAQDSPYPGQNAPLMLVQGNTAYVDFTGSDSTYYLPTTTSKNFFGIRIWFYGIFDKSIGSQNIFMNNYAPSGKFQLYYNVCDKCTSHYMYIQVRQHTCGLFLYLSSVKCFVLTLLILRWGCCTVLL